MVKAELRIYLSILAFFAFSLILAAQTPAAPDAKAATMAPPLSDTEMKPFLQSVLGMSTAQGKELAAETDEYRAAKVEFQRALDFYNVTVSALRKTHAIPANCFPDAQTSTWLQAKPDGSGAMPCVVAATKAEKAEKK